MANTRITQGVIKPNENYLAGIITAQNINVTGVLTYEDVTNVDSIGVITARKGIVSSGVVTATAFHGDGSNLTGIDATALKDSGGNVKIQAQASGAMHTGFSTMQNLRVTGIATFGSGSTTIDNNVINVGTALTLGHTQGLQFHTQNLHSRGFEINQINASGIITASKFVGDGSDLLNLPAGLGTALSSSQSSPLNKIYYTNSVLGIDNNTTIDVPASASAAYTQYTDINIANGADLIISDGDDLIPDVLGLRPDGTLGGGSLGRMRVDKLVGKDTTSAVNVEKGLVVTGVVTATSFVGSGANLTSLPAQATIANNADNRIITGGSGVNLNGEANLNFDGTGLVLAGHIDIRTGSSINTNVTGGTTSGTLHKNTTNGEFAIVSGGTGGNNYLTFYTSASAAPTEKFRIAHNGAIGIGGANYGTSGQFLQSQGSGSAVQWATVSSDFVKISSTTMSGEAAQFELDFDTSTYNNFKIYLMGLNLSYDANLYVRFKVGGTIQTNNAYYGGTIKKHAGGFDNSTYGGQHQNYGYLTDNVGGNDATYERYSGIFDINCGNGGGMPFLRHDSFYKDAAGNHANTMGIVGYQNWSIINGIRFYASSGNINHGRFELYGIK